MLGIYNRRGDRILSPSVLSSVNSSFDSKLISCAKRKLFLGELENKPRYHKQKRPRAQTPTFTAQLMEIDLWEKERTTKSSSDWLKSTLNPSYLDFKNIEQNIMNGAKHIRALFREEENVQNLLTSPRKCQKILAIDSKEGQSLKDAEKLRVKEKLQEKLKLKPKSREIRKFEKTRVTRSSYIKNSPQKIEQKLAPNFSEKSKKQIKIKEEPRCLAVEMKKFQKFEESLSLKPLKIELVDVKPYVKEWIERSDKFFSLTNKIGQNLKIEPDVKPNVKKIQLTYFKLRRESLLKKAVKKIKITPPLDLNFVKKLKNPDEISCFWAGFKGRVLEWNDKKFKNNLKRVCLEDNMKSRLKLHEGSSTFIERFMNANDEAVAQLKRKDFCGEKGRDVTFSSNKLIVKYIQKIHGDVEETGAIIPPLLIELCHDGVVNVYNSLSPYLSSSPFLMNRDGRFCLEKDIYFSISLTTSPYSACPHSSQLNLLNKDLLLIGYHIELSSGNLKNLRVNEIKIDKGENTCYLLHLSFTLDRELKKYELSPLEKSIYFLTPCLGDSDRRLSQNFVFNCNEISNCRHFRIEIYPPPQLTPQRANLRDKKTDIEQVFKVLERIRKFTKERVESEAKFEKQRKEEEALKIRPPAIRYR